MKKFLFFWSFNKQIKIPEVSKRNSTLSEKHTKWSLRISTFRGFQTCSSPYLCDIRDLNPYLPFCGAVLSRLHQYVKYKPSISSFLSSSCTIAVAFFPRGFQTCSLIWVLLKKMWPHPFNLNPRSIPCFTSIISLP